MEKNRKKLILESIERMDLRMLDVLLDDDLTYQNAKKDVFLDKLKLAFLEFKKCGDTFLHSYSGACCSETCSNKGCQGYSFVGNNSRSHLDLIIEETETEIRDMYVCGEFKIDHPNLELFQSISIDIKEDENANFKPSVEFLIFSQKCRLACEELEQFGIEVIGRDVYSDWLEKHQGLHNRFDLPPIQFSELYSFFTLYHSLLDLNNYLRENTMASKALEAFNSIQESDEILLLKWLVQYEELGYNLISFDYFDSVETDNSTYILVHNLRISSADFWNISRFKDLFDCYYWPMLEKYSGKNEDGNWQLFEDEMVKMPEDGIQMNSLSFHFNRKGK